MGLIGNTKEEQFYNFFLEKISNIYGIFGLAGNIRAESNFISTNLQDSYEKKLGMTNDTYTTSVDNMVIIQILLMIRLGMVSHNGHTGVENNHCMNTQEN